jgi:3-isopropylmalate/(R)-2-methylmalate dehydratase large subunit
MASSISAAAKASAALAHKVLPLPLPPPPPSLARVSSMILPTSLPLSQKALTAAPPTTTQHRAGESRRAKPCRVRAVASPARAPASTVSVRLLNPKLGGHCVGCWRTDPRCLRVTPAGEERDDDDGEDPGAGVGARQPPARGERLGRRRRARDARRLRPRHHRHLQGGVRGGRQGLSVWDREKLVVIPDHYIFTSDQLANRNVDILRDLQSRRSSTSMTSRTSAISEYVWMPIACFFIQPIALLLHHIQFEVFL